MDASERELLLGYGWGHTKLALSASNIKESKARYENIRLSLLGDSFSIYSFVIVAAALTQAFLPRLHYSHLAQRMGLAPGCSCPWRYTAPLARRLVYGVKEDRSLGVQDLNKLLLSRTNHTGSDIRIATGQVMNAKAFPRQSIEATWWKWQPVFRFRWERSEHINCLELRAILQTLMYRIRHHKIKEARIFHITDSYICMSIIGKGRSGSRFLNRVLKQLNAHLLLFGLTLVLGHVESTENPTDDASREP